MGDEENLSPQKHVWVTYLASKNPWTDRDTILHVAWCPWRNHACQFWWKSLKGFWIGDKSNFGLFRLPFFLKYTVVRECCNGDEGHICIKSYNGLRTCRQMLFNADTMDWWL